MEDELKPGTEVIERATNKRMVALPSREKEGNGAVLFEVDGSYGWCAKWPEEVRVVGRNVLKPEKASCDRCIYYKSVRTDCGQEEPKCLRHSPERWVLLPIGDTSSCKGKQIPFKLYDECKSSRGRIEIR